MKKKKKKGKDEIDLLKLRVEDLEYAFLRLREAVDRINKTVYPLLTVETALYPHIYPHIHDYPSYDGGSLVNPSDNECS
jgi:hypothetical protein